MMSVTTSLINLIQYYRKTGQEKTGKNGEKVKER